MQTIGLTADDTVERLLGLSSDEMVSILDSCEPKDDDSHKLIAGIGPVASGSVSSANADRVLKEIDRVFDSPFASIFTISYDLGLALQGISSGCDEIDLHSEPHFTYSLFDTLILHDYLNKKTSLAGNRDRFAEIERKLDGARFRSCGTTKAHSPESSKSRADYMKEIEKIKEHIRNGDTYQTNLTRKISLEIPCDLSPASIFWRLRQRNPAPFSAFIRRDDSCVVSASPERFFKISGNRIVAQPIKGTRPRGKTPEEDIELRNSLLKSSKDRAENTMIVDLLRNDLGRICEYGSITVDRLCQLETHPSLFHLVSTVSGELIAGTPISDVLRSLFPCGSITGAPKIRTMELIRELEDEPRGLSMGAIGYHIPEGYGISPVTDLSVAIRTMTIRGASASFNVGGGIVIDSDPEDEFEETNVKSRSLLDALGIGTLE